jgi:hypothetical protein
MERLRELETGEALEAFIREHALLEPEPEPERKRAAGEVLQRLGSFHSGFSTLLFASRPLPLSSPSSSVLMCVFPMCLLRRPDLEQTPSEGEHPMLPPGDTKALPNTIAQAGESETPTRLLPAATKAKLVYLSL